MVDQTKKNRVDILRSFRIMINWNSVETSKVASKSAMILNYDNLELY